MYEGKIIKFYREKAKLTQQQLGEGICSDTHVSKIERGMTDYSRQITSLFSKRLGINIEEEVKRYKNIKKLLNRWHDAIIKELFNEAKTIKDELEKEPLLQITDYQILYELLKARYHLLHNNLEQTDIIIKVIQIKHKDLPPYESNLLKHLLGIYYLSKQDMIKAVDILKTINAEDYKNPEYYLNLATAYLAVNSKVMAYYFAEKSLQYFIKTNNILKMIDAEMIMLMTRESDGLSDFQKIVEQYKALTHTCELCHAPDKKARLLHNLAFEHYTRHEYVDSSRLYQQSMVLKEKKSAVYLISLEGFIRSCFEGNLLSDDKLKKLCHDGLSTSREINQYLYLISFKLLLYLINNQQSEYFCYLSSEALPYFKKCGYVTLVQRYEKELFNYYLKTDEKGKALELADILINAG
ncbi:helix-turn-helix domain-containing protein [Cytobacillus oceanisediminis]|uniref:helix-turn-helix domain-containing protein n=1 Tax=Cytobacillus oceanisediminis TaxID=665099 RepID=UPI0023DAD33B|nr:helix-turn-helix domain-containing protein [Cytobacillus oceanisediminis]MDF2038417.1 helix-turn-helix domain-containing protein [Cytobacillus oceanisediminis]